MRAVMIAEVLREDPLVVSVALPPLAVLAALSIPEREQRIEAALVLAREAVLAHVHEADRLEVA